MIDLWYEEWLSRNNYVINFCSCVNEILNCVCHQFRNLIQKHYSQDELQKWCFTVDSSNYISNTKSQQCHDKSSLLIELLNLLSSLDGDSKNIANTEVHWLWNFKFHYYFNGIHNLIGQINTSTHLQAHSTNLTFYGIMGALTYTHSTYHNALVSQWHKRTRKIPNTKHTNL